MNLYEKIEEIRQKPEHVRKRYAWACVVISMVLVLGIWALSLKSRQYQIETAGQVAGENILFEELKKQKENIGQYKQELDTTKNDLNKSLQDISVQAEKQVIENGDGFSDFSSIPAGNINNNLPTNPADLFQ